MGLHLAPITPQPDERGGRTALAALAGILLALIAGSAGLWQLTGRQESATTTAGVSRSTEDASSPVDTPPAPGRRSRVSAGVEPVAGDNKLIVYLVSSAETAGSIRSRIDEVNEFRAGDGMPPVPAFVILVASEEQKNRIHESLMHPPDGEDDRQITVVDVEAT